MINHWKAAKGCANLNSFAGKQQSSATYKEMIAEGTIKGQCKQLIKLYMQHDEGLTDVQASHMLHWDASTVSARRNDLTRKIGAHAVVTSGKRSNGEGRRCGLVWQINDKVIL